jgi:hypothetical protein
MFEVTKKRQLLCALVIDVNKQYFDTACSHITEQVAVHACIQKEPGYPVAVNIISRFLILFNYKYHWPITMAAQSKA